MSKEEEKLVMCAVWGGVMIIAILFQILLLAL